MPLRQLDEPELGLGTLAVELAFEVLAGMGPMTGEVDAMRKDASKMARICVTGHHLLQQGHRFSGEQKRLSVR